MPPFFVPVSFVSRHRVDLLLLLVAVVWGSSYLATKELTESAGVFAVLAARFIVTSVVMVVVCAVRRESRPGRRELLIGGLLGVTQAGILALETWGVSLTSATNAGLIISLTLVFTPVLESVAVKRWLPRPFFIATVVAVVGVALLVSEDGFHAPTPGDSLMLAAALVRAVHVTAMGRLTAGTGHSSVTLTMIQSAVCAVLYTLLDLPGLVRATAAFGPAQWAGVLYLSLACSVFAFLVQMWAVRRTSAARASLLMGTEPVWAVAVSVIVGGEQLGVIGMVGAALIVAGTYAAQRLEARHRAAVAHPDLPPNDPRRSSHGATRLAVPGPVQEDYEHR